MLIVVKTLCASLQMGLEQLADVNRAMEQHHNTLWDLHLRQTLCDAKHLSQSCQRKSIDFSLFVDLFPLWDLREKQSYQTTLAIEASQQPIVLKQKNKKTKSIN